jgi:hypothetical protein
MKDWTDKTFVEGLKLKQMLKIEADKKVFIFCR